MQEKQSEEGGAESDRMKRLVKVTWLLLVLAANVRLGTSRITVTLNTGVVRER